MSWTPDLADTWAQVYGLVAKVRSPLPSSMRAFVPAYWEADVARVERRSVVEVGVLR
jgi:hypothetical protein